jgi:hypothetical protein
MLQRLLNRLQPKQSKFESQHVACMLVFIVTDMIVESMGSTVLYSSVDTHRSSAHLSSSLVLLFIVRQENC